MTSETRITGPYRAIVDGKSTGLAGCSDARDCERAAYCLRADPALAMRVKHEADGGCRSFILSCKEAA